MKQDKIWLLCLNLKSLDVKTWLPSPESRTAELLPSILPTMASRSTDYSAWQEHQDLIHTLYVVQNQSQDEVLETLKKPPYCLHATLVVDFIIFLRIIY